MARSKVAVVNGQKACTMCHKIQPLSNYSYTHTPRRRCYAAVCKACKAEENWLKLMSARSDEQIETLIKEAEEMARKYRAYLLKRLERSTPC